MTSLQKLLNKISPENKQRIHNLFFEKSWGVESIGMYLGIEPYLIGEILGFKYASCNGDRSGEMTRLAYYKKKWALYHQKKSAAMNHE